MASRRSSADVQKLIASVSPVTRELNGRYCSLITSRAVMSSQELRAQVDAAYRAKDLDGLARLMNETPLPASSNGKCCTDGIVCCCNVRTCKCKCDGCWCN